MTTEYTMTQNDGATLAAVGTAFTALEQQLRAAALAPNADFYRCAAFWNAVLALEDRWTRAEPPHGRRGQKGGRP